LTSNSFCLPRSLRPWLRIQVLQDATHVQTAWQASQPFELAMMLAEAQNLRLRTIANRKSARTTGCSGPIYGRGEQGRKNEMAVQYKSLEMLQYLDTTPSQFTISEAHFEDETQHIRQTPLTCPPFRSQTFRRWKVGNAINMGAKNMSRLSSNMQLPVFGLW
jgi:hypothetical protein